MYDRILLGRMFARLILLTYGILMWTDIARLLMRRRVSMWMSLREMFPVWRRLIRGICMMMWHLLRRCRVFEELGRSRR